MVLSSIPAILGIFMADAITKPKNNRSVLPVSAVEVAAAVLQCDSPRRLVAHTALHRTASEREHPTIQDFMCSLRRAPWSIQCV